MRRSSAVENDPERTSPAADSADHPVVKPEDASEVEMSEEAVHHPVIDDGAESGLRHESIRSPMMFLPHALFPGNGVLGFPPHMPPNFLCHTYENRARWIENMPFGQRPLPLIAPGYHPYLPQYHIRPPAECRRRRRGSALPPIDQALRALYLMGQSLQREKEEEARLTSDREDTRETDTQEEEW